MASASLVGKFVVFYRGAPYPQTLQFVDRKVYRIIRQAGPIRCDLECVRNDNSLETPKPAGRMGHHVLGVYETLETAGAVLDCVSRFHAVEAQAHKDAMAEIKSLGQN